MRHENDTQYKIVYDPFAPTLRSRIIKIYIVINPLLLTDERRVRIREILHVALLKRKTGSLKRFYNLLGFKLFVVFTTETTLPASSLPEGVKK